MSAEAWWAYWLSGWSVVGVTVLALLRRRKHLHLAEMSAAHPDRGVRLTPEENAAFMAIARSLTRGRASRCRSMRQSPPPSHPPMTDPPAHPAPDSDSSKETPQ